MCMGFGQKLHLVKHCISHNLHLAILYIWFILRIWSHFAFGQNQNLVKHCICAYSTLHWVILHFVTLFIWSYSVFSHTDFVNNLNLVLVKPSKLICGKTWEGGQKCYRAFPKLGLGSAERGGGGTIS